MAALALLLALLFPAALSAKETAPPSPPSPAPVQLAQASPPAAAVPDTSADQGSDSEIESQKRELESLRQELEQRRQLSQQLKGKERNILGDLRDTERNLQLTQRYLKALERRRRAVMGDLGQTTSELGRTAVQLEEDRKRLSWRLREIFKRGRSRDIEYILSARSFGDLVTRTYYLARVAREDRQQMLLTQARRVAVQDTKTRLEERKVELDRLARETQRERQALSRLTADRRRLLKGVRSDAKSNEQAQAEIQRASRRIQGLIEQLEKRRIASERGAPGELPLFGDFSKNRGRLAWPVNGRIVR
ncbi:MAG TPA: hypothetical protein VK123_07380, partial [Candidatus Limnocylindrales bacterium]|nr:hypothetical protein [Candidatus Limnocylindrales bacterium]